MFKKVGVVGYGAFGKLLVSELASAVSQVVVYDQVRLDNLPVGVQAVEISDFTDCDVVFLAVTFDAFEQVLPKLVGVLGKDAIVADVCSVKLKPLASMRKILPDDTKIVATHPLFGPESSQAAQTRKAVICLESDQESRLEIAKLYESLGWEVSEMTADEHDLEMAKIHGLTFFIAQTLLELNLPEPKMPTGFYSNLQNLIRIQSKHSDQLTQTIEKHNPYSAAARAQFLEKAKNLDHKFTD